MKRSDMKKKARRKTEEVNEEANKRRNLNREGMTWQKNR